MALIAFPNRNQTVPCAKIPDLALDLQLKRIQKQQIYSLW